MRQDIRDRASASGAVIRWSASWGWGSYESGRTAAGRLCRCSRGPGVVGCEHLKSTHVNPHTHACRGRSIVAHSRALRVDGNREIMRNSNTGNGRGRAPMCAHPPHHMGARPPHARLTKKAHNSNKNQPPPRRDPSLPCATPKTLTPSGTPTTPHTEIGPLPARDRSDSARPTRRRDAHDELESEGHMPRTS